MKVKLLSPVRLFATPWRVAYQAPRYMGFSRQEYWSGLPFPSPGYCPNPGIKPGSPALQTDALPYEPLGKPAPPIHKAWGAVKDKWHQERSSGRVCQNKFQTQQTFKKPNAAGQLYSHTLGGGRGEEKLFKKHPNGHRMRCSASLIMTRGMAMKTNRENQIQSGRMAILTACNQ